MSIAEKARMIYSDNMANDGHSPCIESIIAWLNQLQYAYDNRLIAG